MKKVILVLIISCCMMCASCSGSLSDSIAAAEDNIEFWDESAQDLELDDTIGVVTDFEVDQYLAAEIGTAILKKVYGEKMIEGTKCVVTDGDYFFEVSRFPWSEVPEENAPGSDYTVAINKEDGKILKIWVRE